jgi:hypothetical protein
VPGLTDHVAYRAFFLFDLTDIDFKRHPQFVRVREMRRLAKPLALQIEAAADALIGEGPAG